MKTKELIARKQVLEYQNYFREQMNVSKNDYNLATKIEQYTSFKTSQIQTVIEELVNSFEGEKYSCIEVDHDTYKYKSGIWGGTIANVMDRVLLVTKGDFSKKEIITYTDIDIDHNTIDEKIKEGNTFEIQREEFAISINYVDFYRIKGEYLVPTVDYQRFTYVKDFIDFVIGYRLKNSMKNNDISTKQLLCLLSIFIKANKQTIKNNYQKKNEDREKQHDIKKLSKV